MTRHIPAWLVVLTVCATAAGAAWAQDAPAAPPGVQPFVPPPPPPPAISVSANLEVILVRTRAGKETSRLPYTLTVTTGPGAGPSSLRMGGEVPVAMGAVGVQYRAVGTNIDASAAPVDGNRFRINVTIEDTSVYEDDVAAAPTPVGRPVLRTFRAANTIVLRDGQSARFVAATDRVSGEVVHVEVRLTVLK